MGWEPQELVRNPLLCVSGSWGGAWVRLLMTDKTLLKVLIICSEVIMGAQGIPESTLACLRGDLLAQGGNHDVPVCTLVLLTPHRPRPSLPDLGHPVLGACAVHLGALLCSVTMCIYLAADAPSSGTERRPSAQASSLCLTPVRYPSSCVTQSYFLRVEEPFRNQ